MKLNDYFIRAEFTCGCGCGFDTVDFKLIEIVTYLRFYFDTPVMITSGNRCHNYNEEVQKAVNPDYVSGSSKSQHLHGKAADIIVKGISPTKIYKFLDGMYKDQYGLGNGKSFTHIDVRSGEAARWSY